MKKILLQIKNNKLFFSIKRRLNTEQKSLINTNVISQNELVFSDEYIYQNNKLVTNFVKELVKDYNINSIVIKEYEIVPLIMKITSNCNRDFYLYLLEESIINYDLCKSIIKNSSIIYVSLYNIPTFLLELLDKENIKVESRNEILFLSNFIKENELDKFSSLYYKTKIHMTFPLSNEDNDDFISFININKYLKTIYVNKVNKNDIEYILNILYKHKLKNIKIYIEDNINDYNLIEYLKKLNKRNAKINKIQFKIDYSKEYLEKNIMNQIELNTIKMCVFISLVMVSFVAFFVFYSNYSSMQKVEDIQKDISNTIAEHKDENPPQEEIPEETPIEIPEEQTEEKEKIIINNDLASLKEINEDTVGWLKVNNTNVDYPVVQAQDNDFYLKKNFKKKKDSSGWIFMDYHADAVNLSQNTIIFGHNMYYSGVMFGTLYKVKRSNWYTKEENQIITFNTLYKNMKWKIFSIYVVPKTNDYLISSFSSKEKFQSFLDLITERSIYAFNTPVASDDKILTLSTCSNNGKNRLVIHAVLLNEE